MSAFTQRKCRGVTVLDIGPRLDLVNGQLLKDFVNSFTGKRLHLNFSNTNLINSSGLSALVSCLKEIRLRRGKFTMSNLKSYVNEIFEITNLSYIFDVYESESEAIKSILGGRR